MRKIALAWMRRTRTLEGGPEMDRLSRQELQEVISSLEVQLVITSLKEQVVMELFIL